VDGTQTLLLLVGRGTSDPDANASVARVARFLWEAYGVGWAAVAFASLASPGVDEALGVCRRMGFRRIVVQPYFLFDGVLLKRIQSTAARHAEAEQGSEIVWAPHLRSHPLLLHALEDRAHEAFHGSPNMNCELCKYRVRLTGREADLGAPQAGHHHHVRADADDHEHVSRRTKRVEAVAEAVDHPWDERLLKRLHVVGAPSRGW
jgi:sirohydrochlorin cobaltochelatase